MIDIRQWRIIVGFVSTDVVVMIQRPRDDSGQMSRAQNGVALMQVSGDIENHRHVIHAHDVFQQTSTLMLRQRD